jgi:hypothetical protein
MMGRSNSAFVLEGSRKYIKDWTSGGLFYKDFKSAVPTPFFQAFVRIGSFLMLLLVFTTIPNGSTIAQLSFVLLNTMRQINILSRQWLNSKRCSRN